MSSNPRAACDVPISVWYLTFYCNPAIKLVVVNKIIIEGVCGVAALYGESTEKYLHVEEECEGADLETVDLVTANSKLTAGYHVSSVSSVCLHHVAHVLLLPLTAAREIFSPIREALTRDLGGK